uniref:Uncharacterized protein n=1 Tax=Anguilla anguilla TaxID=7936 RepID=A0A0E9UJ31_ANGAN
MQIQHRPCGTVGQACSPHITHLHAHSHTHTHTHTHMHVHTHTPALSTPDQQKV